MADVIDLNSRRPVDDPVYQCDCGSQVFILEAGGSVRCLPCNAPQQNLIWGSHFVSKLRPDLNKPDRDAPHSR